MIHGMWGGGHYWENYKIFFEQQGYKCVATTLRFHDMNPDDTPDPRLGTTSLLDYADDLEKEIRQLDIKPIIMGHSMGGLLAQMLASRGLAKALILLTPAAPAGILSLTPSVVRSFLKITMRWGFWKKPARQTFKAAAYSVLHMLTPEEQKKAYDKYVDESGQAIHEIAFWLLDFNKASKVDETKVTCPTLVIGSTKDRITPASVTRKIANKYKAVAAYKEFENHSHWVVAEPGWQEVAGYAADWLKSKAHPDSTGTRKI